MFNVDLEAMVLDKLQVISCIAEKLGVETGMVHVNEEGQVSVTVGGSTEVMMVCQRAKQFEHRISDVIKYPGPEANAPTEAQLGKMLSWYAEQNLPVVTNR